MATLAFSNAVTPQAVQFGMSVIDLTFLIGAPPNLKMLYETQLKRPRDLSL